MEIICGCTLPLRQMLFLFFLWFLATNMPGASWSKYEILIQRENKEEKKKKVCFVWLEMLLYCILLFSALDESQKVSVLISLTPPLSKSMQVSFCRSTALKPYSCIWALLAPLTEKNKPF